MQMSERNKLLIELQDAFVSKINWVVSNEEFGANTVFTTDEIKGALQHIILTYGKIES